MKCINVFVMVTQIRAMYCMDGTVDFVTLAKQDLNNLSSRGKTQGETQVKNNRTWESVDLKNLMDVTSSI